MQMPEKVGKSRNTVFFSMICGFGWSKSRLAKAAGAEPAGQMSDEKLHAVVARSTFPSQNVQSTSAADRFWKLRCRKSARRCGAKHISKSKCTKHLSSGALLDVQMSFCVVGARDCAPCQKWTTREGFVAVSKTLAGVGHLKRICKDACRMAGAVQETCYQRCQEVRALISSEGFNFGASDLQVCWDDFAWQVQHLVWPDINFSWQAQYFRQVG